MVSLFQLFLRNYNREIVNYEKNITYILDFIFRIFSKLVVEERVYSV